ncbi:3'(2'),5'-bisphosphate nucleotidase CysQ [[Pasteurella] aerogenes]
MTEKNVLLTPMLLQATLTIAHQAGELLTRFYATSVKIHTKADNTPVTEADLAVSQFLSEKLTALTPDIPVLSEESQYVSLALRQNWECYWLIDPLDGTQQFINRSGQFSVLIALIQQNRPILGIIHAPVLQQTFYATKGHGAYKINHGQQEKLQYRPLDANQPIHIVVGTEGAVTKVRSILSPNFQYQFQIYGSSGLKSTLVAGNIADCYIRLGKTGEWDTAASEIILAEMGGKIMDLNFNPLTYNQRETFVNPDFIMVSDALFNWQKIFQYNSL